jgi:nitrous oxide reductase accessory protein NosL
VSRRPLAALALLAAVVCRGPALAAGAADPGPAAATFTCAACGMRGEVAGRFSARLEAGGSTLYFCDIGDLVWYLARNKPEGFAAAVHDLPSGEWVDARSALYAIDKKAYATPMGWGVAAFRDRAAVAARGAALDFEALRAALR